MLYWETELNGLHINTDWSNTSKMDIIENKPELGNPIRRLRSRNVKQTLTCSMLLDYNQFNNIFKPFVYQKLHGGLDSFYFKSFIDGINHITHLVITNGSPFKLKRQNNNSYMVNFVLEYIEIGVV